MTDKLMLQSCAFMIEFDLMDLGKLTGWLEEAIGGANHDGGK